MSLVSTLSCLFMKTSHKTWDVLVFWQLAWKLGREFCQGRLTLAWWTLLGQLDGYSLARFLASGLNSKYSDLSPACVVR